MREWVKNFLVNFDQTVEDAFRQITMNQNGAVFIQDKDRKIIGVATDGDIRAKLLQKHTISSPIVDCMNKNFTYSKQGEARENILKLLDGKIHVVPVLNDRGELVDVVTRKFFPSYKEQNVIARAKSPVRISFGGGGTDLTHYFMENGSHVLNATIDMFSHATLRKRTDQKIVIESFDLKKKIEVDSLSDISHYKEFDLIGSALQIIRPSYGFDLEIHSDFPVGSGLGGSSVVLSAILGCFNQFREDRWDSYEIAELAFQAERISMGVAGGWQDQYATVFGGFNYMEFKKEGNIVHPLRIRREITLELEENLILCHTNQTRASGKMHESQKNEFKKNEDYIHQLSQANKQITLDMKADLLKGKLCAFAKKLDSQWQLKKQYSSDISNQLIDNIYNCAKEHGAIGGKLLGAGGGGFILLYIEPFRKTKVINALADLGVKVQSIKFDYQGLQSWTVRDENGGESI